VTEPSREITIAMLRPKAQVSTYIDNSGKESQITPGVQEPIRPKKTVPAATGTTNGVVPSANSTSQK
jgi:hypothetical protein